MKTHASVLVLAVLGLTHAGCSDSGGSGGSGGGIAPAAGTQLVVVPPAAPLKAALKIILPHLTSNESYLLRFRQEAKVTQSLQHPGIVRFLDYGEEPVPHLALELVDCSLAEHLSEIGRLSVRAVLDLAIGIVEALAYAHDRKIIHRDLKPANILLRGKAPVVADFGLGREELEDTSETRLTITGQAMGTPHYMAPEQINDSKHVGPGADVYSLGAIVFALLAGQPPFTGPTAKAFLAHFKAQVPDVRCWAPDVPSALVTLISDMMAKTAEKRPSTRTAAESLKTIRSKLPPPAPEASGKPLGAVGGWTLLEELRTSGTGRLYLCSKQENCASLLMLPSATTPDDASLKRYRKRIATLRRLKHPNVAEVLEVGLVQRGDSRRLYVITERPGDDLFQLLGQLSSLWPTDAVLVTIGAARALAAAHEVGVFHGSVKPESIILADGVVRSDAVRVADFGAGFPRELGSGSRSGQAGSQPHTMAPERATDEAVGAPADVYGLAATLFQLLTGSTLYAGPTATLLVAHATQLPDRADHRSGRVPRELGLIIDLALLKSPAERPTMVEFLELLDAYADQELTPKRLKTVRLRAETARKRFARTRRF
jgi:serine/threonine protein kinase